MITVKIHTFIVALTLFLAVSITEKLLHHSLEYMQIALHLRYLSALKSQLLKARLLNTTFVYSPFLFSVLDILFIGKI